jgi:hypothetical protein
MKPNLNVAVTNTRHRCRLAAVVAALVVSFGSASQAGANCAADVVVENKKPLAIKVLRFEYRVGGKTFTEPLANKRLAKGERETWRTQNLGHVNDGQVITTTRVEFKEDTSGVGSPIGDPYGPPKWSDYHDHSSTYICFDGRDYYVSVE